MISVSADCQCSHLNILESCAVAVRGKDRDWEGGVVSVTRLGGNGRQTHVLSASGGVMPVSL